MKENCKYKAALFDLDGVVFDTEPQYTIFWGEECRRYHPEIPGLEYKIKGQTLVEIYEHYFADFRDEWELITQRLNQFEADMQYIYVEGFLGFMEDLKLHGIKTAVVTSSNLPKMRSVYKKVPELLQLFDKILTSEDFSASKPDPDCYLRAAALLSVDIKNCIVLEDSINGLKSGRGSGAAVVGLTTSNPADVIKDLCDVSIPDYVNCDFCKLSKLLP